MLKAFDFCIPTRGTKVPHTPDWLHEIKYDGYRLRVERNGDRVRLITRNGYDWTQRYPWIVIQLAKSIIGGAMIAGQWISACVRPIVAEHSRRAKGIIMAVHRGEVVIFVLEHEAGVAACAVARDTLLDLARRHRAD